MATAVGDIIRVALRWLVNSSDQMVNVHNLEVQALGASPTDLLLMQALETAFQTGVYNTIVGAMANNIVGDILTGLNLTQDTVLPPVAQNINGTVTTSDTLPWQTCPLVFMNTGSPRRQGRQYLPAFVEAVTDDNGNWVGGGVTSIAAWALAILAPFSSGGYTFQRVVGSDVLTGFVKPTVAGFPINSRTQRRRTPGRGG